MLRKSVNGDQAGQPAARACLDAARGAGALEYLTLLLSIFRFRAYRTGHNHELDSPFLLRPISVYPENSLMSCGKSWKRTVRSHAASCSILGYCLHAAARISRGDRK